MIMYVLQGTFRKLVIYHGSLAREDLQAAISLHLCLRGSKPNPAGTPKQTSPIHFGFS